MNHGDALQRPAALGGLDVATNLGLGHAGIVLEREACNRLAVLVAAADASESDNRADIGAPMRERARLGGGIERLLLQADGRSHPLIILRSAHSHGREERDLARAR